jgi:hypothetical protein
MNLHGPDPLEGPVSLAISRMSATARRFGRGREEEEVRNRAPIREDLVARVRQEIAAGTYLTAEKWEAALAHLLSHLDCE